MKKIHIHLIGIGGISMSGIAQILLHNGHQVSGSDIKNNHLLDKLRKKGAEIYIGHSAENVDNADLVVVSAAIPEDNVELKFARQKGITVIERAKMIAKLMEEKKGIAVSGTHGKTTTTAMIGFLLQKANLDPTVLLGGELDLFNGNVFIGDGQYFVTEADESDGSLTYFKSDICIINNIELDHHDFYNSEDKLINTFSKFINNLKNEGKAILYADDDNIKKLINDYDVEVLSYGIKNGSLRAVDIQLLPFGSYFSVEYNGKRIGEINLQIPGKHNIINSLACIATGMYIGMSFTEIKNILNLFSGVKRRFEKKGLVEEILIIDDYAHHPTEIKETLKAARNTGYERIITIFQPHRYTRTKHLLTEFANSFDLTDIVIVTSIYSAGEKKIPGVNSKNIAELIKKNFPEKMVEFIKNNDDIIDYLLEKMQPRDLILTIGAGDVYKIGESLLKKIK